MVIWVLRCEDMSNNQFHLFGVLLSMKGEKWMQGGAFCPEICHVLPNMVKPEDVVGVQAVVRIIEFPMFFWHSSIPSSSAGLLITQGDVPTILTPGLTPLLCYDIQVRPGVCSGNIATTTIS